MFVVVLYRSASRDVRADMPKLFRRRQAYDPENIAVAVNVMQRRVHLIIIIILILINK